MTMVLSYRYISLRWRPRILQPPRTLGAAVDLFSPFTRVSSLSPFVVRNREPRGMFLAVVCAG
jgi:hypothetical protein